MPWILSHKKKLVSLFLLFLVIGCFEYFVFQTFAIIFITWLFMLALLFLNWIVLKKMRDEKEPFGTFSQIRNVDFLLIGTLFDAKSFVPEGKSFVQISSPKRGLFSSYQILRHTHSILKEEGGTVVLAFERNRDNFSLFDMPFMHPVTIKKYGLESLKRKSRFPLLFAPVKSLFLIIGGGGGKNSFIQFTDEKNQVYSDTAVFCKERGYQLIALVKK